MKSRAHKQRPSTPEGAKRRYALYTRESSKAQLEGKAYDSHASQADYLRQWVASQGGEVVAVYSDTESGTKLEERDGLMQLLADAQAGRFDEAVAYDLDRWARQMEINFALREVEHQTGVRFISATQPFDRTSPEGKWMGWQIAAMAQFVSDTIGKKVTIKRALMAKTGRWLGGPAPFGYKLVDKTLVPEEREAEIVRLVFALYLEHPSVAAVRHRLKAQGVKNRRGKEWSTSSIEGMLRCRVYLGEIQNAEKYYPGIHEALVEPAVFDAARKKLPTKQRLKSKIERPFPLVGLLVCGHCQGASMTLHYVKKRNGKLIPYYRCTSTFKRGWDSCAVKHVNADKIEAWVAGLVKEVSLSPDVIERAVAEANASSKEAATPLRAREKELLERLREIKSGIASIVDVLKLRGAGAFASLHEALQSAEADRAIVESELSLLREEIGRHASGRIDAERVRTTLADFALLYEAATASERQELLRLVFKRIEFSGPDKPVTAELFDTSPGRLSSSIKRPGWLR